MKTMWAAALALAASAWAAGVTDCSLVPGWQQQGKARSYVADNLFEYMDGNAEGYLIYGFAGMQGVTCQKGGDTLLIDVSDMGEPDSAYGIFTANQNPNFPVERLGMAGQVMPRRAIFCKDKYYVEIAANPEKDHSAALRAYATAIEKLIPGRTALPDSLGWFPKEKLVSLRLVPESVLGLRLLKRGYAAQYDYAKAFVVKEESPQAATAVMEKLRARIGQTQAAKVADEAFQVSDKYLGRLCFFRKGRYIGGYANVAEGMDPLALAAALAERLQ